MVALHHRFYLDVKPGSRDAMLLFSQSTCITDSCPYPHRLYLYSTQAIHIPEVRTQIISHVECSGILTSAKPLAEQTESIPSTSPFLFIYNSSSGPMSLHHSLRFHCLHSIFLPIWCRPLSTYNRHTCDTQLPFFPAHDAQTQSVQPTSLPMPSYHTVLLRADYLSLWILMCLA